MVMLTVSLGRPGAGFGRYLEFSLTTGAREVT